MYLMIPQPSSLLSVKVHISKGIALVCIPYFLGNITSYKKNKSFNMLISWKRFLWWMLNSFHLFISLRTFTLFEFQTNNVWVWSCFSVREDSLLFLADYPPPSPTQNSVLENKNLWLVHNIEFTYSVIPLCTLNEIFFRYKRRSSRPGDYISGY